jgi:hypothetical protein
VANDEVAARVQGYIDASESDLYLFSGEISRVSAAEFVRTVCARSARHPKATIFLTTYGGDPNAAYRMAKALRRSYQVIRLLVVGPCKSAGTLIALGANELAFSPTGELGPLDVQLTKPDEIFVLGSGLDVLQAVRMITETAFDSFEQFMISLGARSGGAISTKMAAEVASSLSTKLFEPIAAQIDPLRLGEVQRAIRIARTYGERLADNQRNLKPNAIDELIEGYPSHGFVIDMEEAQKLFVSVTALTDEEEALAADFTNALREPAPSPLSVDLGELFSSTPPDNEANSQAEGNDASAAATPSEAGGELGAPSGNGTGPEEEHPAERSEALSGR